MSLHKSLSGISHLPTLKFNLERYNSVTLIFDLDSNLLREGYAHFSTATFHTVTRATKSDEFHPQTFGDGTQTGTYMLDTRRDPGRRASRPLFSQSSRYFIRALGARLSDFRNFHVTHDSVGLEDARSRTLVPLFLYLAP